MYSWARMAKSFPLYKSFNTRQKICFDFILVVMNLGDLLKYHILFMEWKVPKAEQSAPTPHHTLYHRDTIKVQFGQ